MAYEEVNKRLRRLQLYNSILALVALIIVVGFAFFSVWQVVVMHEQQRDLQTLTYNLCDALTRAGIILELDGVDPCER